MNSSQYDHQKLKRIRQKRFTQEAIARKVNVHYKTISRAERGINASFDLLQGMMAACGRSVKEIIYSNPTS